MEPRNETPPSRSAAAAAAFCVRRGALAEYRRLELAAATLSVLADSLGAGERYAALDRRLAGAWAAYVEAGGTLAELYGVAS